MSDERAPAIFKCSKDAFRIYTNLCAGSKEEKPKSKGKKKIKKKIFPSRTPAFFLAAAIGILNDRHMKVKTKMELTRREFIVNNLNFHPFSQLIKSKYNIKSEPEIVKKLLEFQEFGIRELYDEYHKTGDIDFLRFYRTAKSEL